MKYKRSLTRKLSALLVIALFCFVSCQPKNQAGNKKTDSEKFTNKDGLPEDLSRTSTPEEAAQFAWNTFLTINEDHPNGNGTKWENYKEAYDIFMPNAKVPTLWGKPTPEIEPSCEALKTGGKILRTTSKVSPIINETNQAVGGVLIDRNSNIVHYEVYMNKPMFEYVLENKFYNALSQAGSKIDFPMGSMELKASWRILDETVDDISRYHTSKAIIYIPNSALIRKDDCLPQTVINKMKVCSEVLVGLVGLHIVYKTPSNPNFTWMTFEQIDNVESHEVDGKIIPASFRNKDKVITGCPDNSRQCDCPEQETSQITRQVPIPDWVSTINIAVQDSLRKTKSIWAYYELVGIQWAKDDSRTGTPILVNLGNTSMETFNQTSSSCIGCHAFARSSNPTINSDFSWVMGRAQNPKVELPDSTGRALLKYIMREKPYKEWSTWPDSKWNIFSKVTAGENPHGVSIRIYVNDIAIDYYNSIKDNLPSKPELPIGSIVMKENFRSVPTVEPQPSDLVELTAMYKTKNSKGEAQWFWMKARPFGPVDMAGFNKVACSSCHMNWKGNGDGMLSFNFGKPPVIKEKRYTTHDSISQKYSLEEIKTIKRYINQELESFERMNK
jgi:hypothetical protein